MEPCAPVRIRLADANLAGLVSSAALATMPPTAIPGLLAKVQADPDHANVFMQCYHLFDAIGNESFALEMQRKALERRRSFRIAGAAQPAVRLLALMGPGGRMVNAPLEFVVHGGDIRLEQLYLAPGDELPDTVPDHDVAILAYSDVEEAEPLLPLFDRVLAHWPRPLLNRPERVRRCARDTLSQGLADVRGLRMPRSLRASRDELLSACPLPFPATIRPIGSHAGKALARIASAAELAAYLEGRDETAFFVTEYVDYRSADGHFRKLRIALIDGAPFVCHVAIGDDWMVHYKSAGMEQAAWKREEEARTMAAFPDAFVPRHRDALAAIGDWLGLDYVVIDCAELADGRLLLFEADTGGWIHATDSVDLFPYKQPVMQRAFAAFRDMVLARRA